MICLAIAYLKYNPFLKVLTIVFQFAVGNLQTAYCKFNDCLSLWQNLNGLLLKTQISL